MNSILNPTIPLTNSWSGLTLDVESALNAAVNMTTGTLVDFSGAVSSNEITGIGSGQAAGSEILSQLFFTLPPQALNMNFPPFHSNTHFHPLPGPANVLTPPYYQPPNFGSVAVSTFDQLHYPPDHSLSSFNSIQPSATLFTADSNSNSLNVMRYPASLSNFPTSPTFTRNISTVAGQTTSSHSNHLTQWTTGGVPLPVDHLAKYFIRIKGMPPDTDILDILTFLEDSWRNVALHGVHRVYNVLVSHRLL